MSATIIPNKEDVDPRAKNSGKREGDEQSAVIFPNTSEKIEREKH